MEIIVDRLPAMAIPYYETMKDRKVITLDASCNVCELDGGKSNEIVAPLFDVTPESLNGITSAVNKAVSEGREEAYFFIRNNKIGFLCV